MYDQIMQTQQHATGSAIKENEEYLKSFEARLAQLRRKTEELSLALGDAFLTESMVQFIEVFGSGIELVTSMTSKVGVLPVLFSAVGVSILLLSKNTRSWVQAIAFGSEAISKHQRELIGLESHLKSAEVAGEAFQRTIRSLAVATGLGIGTMLLGWGFEKAISKMAEARQRAEELRNEFNASRRAYAENADDIDKLTQRYANLEDTLKDVSLTPEQRDDTTRDLIDTQERLAELMPEMVIAEDEYGNKIYATAEHMQVRNEMLKRQIELEEQRSKIEAEVGRLEALKQSTKDIQNLNKEINSSVKFLQNLGQVSSQIAFGNAKMFNITDIESATEAIRQLSEEQNKLYAQGDYEQATNLSGYIAQMQEQLAYMQFAKDDIALTNYEIINMHMETLNKVLETTTLIGENSQNVIGSLGILLSQVGATGEEAQQIFSALSYAIQDNELLHEVAQSYEDALARMEQAKELYDLAPTLINQERLEEEVRNLEQAFQRLKDMILEIMRLSGVQSPEVFAQMEKELDSLFFKMMSGKTTAEELSGALNVPLDEVIANLKLTEDGLDSLSDSMDDAGISADELNNRLSSIDPGSNLDELQKAVKETAEETDYLIGVVEGYSLVLDQVSQAELDNAIAIREKNIELELQGQEVVALTEAQLELLATYDAEQDAIIALINQYPNLISAEDAAKLSKEELIYMIQQEMLAQDLLIGGLQLVADGQLSTENHRTFVAFQEANKRINKYREELQALKTLGEAMNAIGNSVKILEGDLAEARARGDKKAMDSIGKQLMRLSQQKGLHDHMVEWKEIQLNEALAERSTQMQRLSRITGILSGASSNYGKSIDKATNATKKGTGASKKNTKAKKDNKKATKANSKEEELASFIADKYKRAIEEVTLALKRQQAIKSQFPKHSKEYRVALENEIKLETQKLELMKQQQKTLEENLRKGKVQKTGVVTGQQASSTKNVTSTSRRKLSGWQANVNSGYGMRWHPILKRYKMHAGVDMAQPLGTRLEANIEGIVKRAFYDKQGYGNVIYVVDNQGREHRYAHLNKIGVKAGQKVGVGDYLGDIGTTGRSTGPHLHYEVWINGKHVNPMDWVKSAKGFQDVVTVVKEVANVNKEVAQTSDDLYKMQSDILNIQGDIIDQQIKIEELQAEIIRSELAKYDKLRNDYGWHLDFEIGKHEQLDKFSKRYVAVLERQIKFIQLKQNANKEEYATVKALIDSGEIYGNMLEELKNRYHELKLEIQATEIELGNMGKTMIDVSIGKFIRRIEEYEYHISRIEQDMRLLEEGSEPWLEQLADKISFMDSKRSDIMQQIEEISYQLKMSNLLNPDDVEEYKRQLRALTLQYRELGIEIHENQLALITQNEVMDMEDLASKIIDTYKNAIRQKQEAHMQSIDAEMKKEDERHRKVLDNYRKELDEFREIINLKIKEIDREDSLRDHTQDMDELDEQRLEIERQLSLLSMDDSREAKYKRKKLQEELKKLDKDVENKQYKWEKDQRKEALNDIMSDKEKEITERERLEVEYHENERKRIEDLREYWNQYYTDLLNDEKKFAQMREDLITGNFEHIEKMFEDLANELETTLPDLENTLGGTMEAVGTMIRQNIIDELRNSLDVMAEMAEYLEKIKNDAKDIPDLDAGLFPSKGGKHDPQTTYSDEDLQVMLGKLIRHSLTTTGKTKEEQHAIKILGSDIANKGREAGSELSDEPLYGDIMEEMTKDDIMAFAKSIEKNLKLIPDDMYELKDLLRKEAERLKVAASFDTGGFTGSWGKSGKFAMLHQNELILNEKETNKFGNLIATFGRMNQLFNNLQSGLIQGNGETTIHNKLEVYIDGFNGNEDDGRKLSEQINAEWMRKMRVERGVR